MKLTVAWPWLAMLLIQTLLVSGEDGDRLRTLTLDLGAADPSVRDAAQAELERLGAEDESGEVEGLLTEAAKGLDPEVASRARTALRAVRYWENIVVVGGTWARALDLEAGTLLWKRDGECEAWVGPRRRGAVVYIAPREGGIEVVDLRTGKSRWKLGGRLRGALLPQGDWVGADSERLYFAQPESGLRWSRAETLGGGFPTKDDVAILGNGLYLRTGNGVIAVRAGTGEVSWRRSNRRELLASAPGALYVFAPSTDGAAIQRLKPDFGTMLWQTPLRGDGWCPPFAGPWVEDDLVVVRNPTGGSVRGLDGRTGEERWSLSGTAFRVLPGVGAHTALVAFRTESGQQDSLRLVDTRDGTLLAEAPTWGGLGRATHAAGRLLLADWVTEFSRRGPPPGPCLWALDPTSLETVWTAEVKGTRGDMPFATTAGELWIEKVGDRVVLWTRGRAGVSMELVDPVDGRVVAREVLAR